MPHNQFILQHGSSIELDLFPHIKEFALRKNTTIHLDSFAVLPSSDLRIYCVIDGKFEWTINRQHHVLYPGNIALVLPGQELGGATGHLDIGTLFSLHIWVDQLFVGSRMMLGKWSTLLENERQSIGKILLLNNLPVLKMNEVAGILHEMHAEIMKQEIGYQTRFNHMLDSLLVIIARQSTRQASSFRDFPKTFTRLEHRLRENLAHQWTVEEMAGLVGLGTTAFTEKVKSFTGFSPLNYLINIRISEAIKLLKRHDVSVTEIALETGFYSSQHFSTTFKKLTGHTPGEFRKRHVSNTQ
jgi:AraC-like DNA-binding protein